MAEEASVPAVPVAFVNPDTGIPTVRPRTWALVTKGVVQKVERSLDWFHHPFGTLKAGDRVVDGTGVDVQPGHMVDAKGNFTPAEGRTAPIPQGLPAYHAGPGVTRHTVDLSAEIGGAKPVTDGGEDFSDATVDPLMGTVEPRNKDMAEHDDGSEPVHATDTGEAPSVKPEDAAEPSGFAAVDKKASDKK